MSELREITGTTVLTGLLGSPVKHSKSPLMHNKAFELLDLDYRYLCFEIDESNLEKAVEGLRVMGVRGFNLTMPNKNLMVDLCDELDISSEIAGAVNTVVNENGRLKGYTTDGIGFMRSAIDAGHDIIGKRMVLLGAGGAATAILTQAALDGVTEIDVFSIKDQFYPRAEAMVEKLNDKTSSKVRLHDFDDESVFKTAIANADILTNATSVGMAPKVEGCIIDESWFKDKSVFHDALAVADIIYNPLETKLLRLAREAGLSTFNGMYMLLYQGAASFKYWTDKDMPTEEIKKLYFQ
ncbi:MAG: shikimate dehydrogenase [Lachnospiraceae bacterium]|nr:shikimate dehydrogenase [Lachnospiraceae bacterium]